MEKSVSEEICQAIKAYLRYEGIAINTVAERLGSTARAVSAQLAGRAFSRKTAQKYAETFGFNPNYLMTGEGSLLPDDQPEKPAPASDISNLIEIIKSQQETIAILVRNGDATKKVSPRFPAKADPLIK